MHIWNMVKSSDKVSFMSHPYIKCMTEQTVAAPCTEAVAARVLFFPLSGEGGKKFYKLCI